MATTTCSWCGGGLSMLERFRGGRLCGNCARKQRDEAAGLITQTVTTQGLRSVDDIARMKKALDRLPGVRRVFVSGGNDGLFEFHVTHEAAHELPATMGDFTLTRLDDTAHEGEGDEPDEATGADDGGSSQKVVVDGLTSVEDVVRVKRQLSQIPGVREVIVEPGSSGAFAFRVVHTSDRLLDDVLEAVPHDRAERTGKRGTPLRVHAKR